ncbi:MAG: hypothetical protein K0S41_554 [Anaerocolumna sp.]|jgi:HlyD family secretion protein|nr:hypothetical protein [Anaerocolumna sp.]
MKPILININEMSDSKEVYESRPNIIITIFIYLIVSILLVALIWMYFGHIDVVVKSEGIIRPNNQVSTIMNTYCGTIESVQVADGEYVNKGDILYVIEHENLLTELELYRNQLNHVNHTLTLLNKYQQSIEDGVNLFENIPDEEEYYLKYQIYAINYEMMSKESAYSSKERELNKDSLTDELNKQNAKLNYTETLKNSVMQCKNLFINSGEQREYYILFEKYLSDYNAIIKQYKNAKTEIDLSTTEAGLVNCLEYYNNQLAGLKLLYSSVKAEENQFSENDNYSLQYKEYENKIAELNTAYEQAKENYELNKELEGLAVSEWDVEQSKIAMEDAKRAIETYKVSYLSSISTNITEVKKNIKDIKLSKDNTISKKELYKQNEEDQNDTLESFKLKYLVELDTTINTLKENSNSLESNISSLELQNEKICVVEEQDNQVANIVEFKSNELKTTIDTIRTYSNKKEELESNINKLNTQIESATVRATRSGVINNNIELVQGDILASGIEVLTIIPEDDSQFKVNIYVNNKDIGKLEEGMEVKFNVYALPNREYGYLTGTVTNISEDIKVDSNNSSGYYLVEADLDHNLLYDSKENETKLKVGMACQAMMITESERILDFCLRKLNLWGD